MGGTRGLVLLPTEAEALERSLPLLVELRLATFAAVKVGTLPDCYNVIAAKELEPLRHGDTEAQSFKSVPG